MVLKIEKKIHCLFFLFFVFTLLFPVVVINKIIFLLIVVVSTLRKEVKLNTLSPLYIISIFTYGFILSLFSNTDRELSLQFLLSTFVLVLIYPIVKYELNLDTIIKKSGLILSLYSLVSFLIVVVFIDSQISSLYYSFFKDYSSGAYGLREFTEDGVISFHTGTAPFLFLPLVLCFESFLEKMNFAKLITIILHISVISVSGSRGTFFTSIIALILIAFYRSRLQTKLVLLLICLPILSVLVYKIVGDTLIFSADEGSNNIKLGHIASFFDNMNLLNLTFGGGLAANYFSKGTGSYLAHTEITPLDMIRYFGFVLAVALYILIFFPTKKISMYNAGSTKLYMMIFGIYLMNSFTNPIMFNSYGLLIVLWYWNKILIHRKKEIKLK